MGLSIAQTRLLALTERKSDLEYGMAKCTANRRILTGDMSELAQEYQRRLSSKKLAYFHNGQFQKLNYNYLMGYNTCQKTLGWNSATQSFDKNVALKDNNSMILTDYKGHVVLNNGYANTIVSVLGSSAIDSNGRGGSFSIDKVPEIIAAFTNYPVDDIRNVINNKNIKDASYENKSLDAITLEETGKTGTTDVTEKRAQEISDVVDFYYPIFSAAAINGWTTEYNSEINSNEDYISDALVSGTLLLETVDNYGAYNPGGSLLYYIMNDSIEERTDDDAKEELSAWYNAEREAIKEKEDNIDLEIKNLSTELEATNTEIQSVRTFIDNAIKSVFSSNA